VLPQSVRSPWSPPRGCAIPLAKANCPRTAIRRNRICGVTGNYRIFVISWCCNVLQTQRLADNWGRCLYYGLAQPYWTQARWAPDSTDDSTVIDTFPGVFRTPLRHAHTSTVMHDPRGNPRTRHRSSMVCPLRSRRLPLGFRTIRLQVVHYSGFMCDRGLSSVS
jgi:hypothetical protein